MKRFIPITKIFINLTMVQLFFVRFFTDMTYVVGVDSSNNTSVVVTLQHFNMIENLNTLDMLYAIPLAIVVIICSVVLAVLSAVMKDNPKLHFVSHVACGISVAVFLLLLWFAAFPDRPII